MTKTWTVTRLTQYISNLFKEDDALQNLTVSGEISNFKHHSSGHMYFTLKDDENVIRCAMFRVANSRLKFEPEDGMKVILHGAVSLYGPSGNYQIIVDRLDPDGLGSLYLAYEQLKARLEKEGLFDVSHKRQLPYIPRNIGVVTSQTGAVIRDIRNVVFRRFPMASIILSPSAVQGVEAPTQLLQALADLQAIPGMDVIIIARGGGSLEDLWAFNNEAVARAIYACTVPVVSAIGHETDFTIADFVADLRAPTPSAAAELVVPNLAEVYASLQLTKTRLAQGLIRRFDLEKLHLKRLAERPVFQNPSAMLQTDRQRLDMRHQQMVRFISRKIDQEKAKIALFSGKLHVLSPLQVLGRGYAVVMHPNGKAISSVRQLSVGEHFTLRLSDGTITAKTENKEAFEGG